MSRLSEDPFFSQPFCSRCPNSLQVRSMSWFNEDVLCTECGDKEDEVKDGLKAKGYDPVAFEGCGYTPDVERMAEKTTHPTH